MSGGGGSGGLTVAPSPRHPGPIAAKPIAPAGMIAPVTSAPEPEPTQAGTCDGLSYTLWLPSGRPHAGVVVLHGAGSRKENHHDYAQSAEAAGLAAIVFDQRGHGASIGQLDGRAIEDIATIAARLRHALGDEQSPVALRGSSMGGCLALAAAAACRARAVVAICPASPAGLRRGIADGTLSFGVQRPAFDALLAGVDLGAIVQSLDVPLLLLHAEGDEQVPVAHSRELATQMRAGASRLVVVPGGDHRSIQHDPELQALSLRFIAATL
jgi:pimeloyl-ACP methyl ester carboxylesterase